MKIIGINSNYDSGMNEIYSGGCALVVDGVIEMALAEDRISRVKNEGGFKQSLQYILNQTNNEMTDIDYFYISFYANPLIPEKDIIEKHLQELGLEHSPEKLVVMPSHHLSHACLAYALSPFDEAIIMVADNEGNLISPKNAAEKGVIFNDCERNSYFYAKGNCITFLERDFEYSGSVGFGKAYNKCNEYVGFGSYLNAGKTMGLSSYGVVPKEWENLDLWHLDEHGKLQSNIIETHDSYRDIDYFFNRHGIMLKDDSDYKSSEYKNIAQFFQKQLNKWSIKKIEYLQNKLGIKNVCISGGVALNGIMNYEIEKQLNCKVFVPPYCSDPGQALGNAIYGYLVNSNKMNNSFIPKAKFENYIYLGTKYENGQIDELVQQKIKRMKIEAVYSTDILSDTAKLIAEGKIVGFFQGRSEYGARALGNRSILARVDSEMLRDKINILKGRELFRPLAPAVKSESWSNYFYGQRSILDTMMLRVVDVKREKYKELQGVTHVDGTARVQDVKREINPIFYELIENVEKLTGIPMVINTSFNKAGEPIVESPAEAIDSFCDMNLDYLVCGNYILSK